MTMIHVAHLMLALCIVTAFAWLLVAFDAISVPAYHPAPRDTYTCRHPIHPDHDCEQRDV